MSKSVELSPESIENALAQGSPTSLTALWKILGGKGSVPGSTAKRLRELVPGLAERLAGNKPAKTAKPTPAPKPKAAPRKPKAAPKADGEQTPYRSGSAYSKVYLILQAHPEGIKRDDLVRLAAKACHKPLRLSTFDVSVVVSPSESLDGPRHRSARPGYWVEKVNQFCRLRLS